MQNSTKKIAIWAGVGVGLVLVYLLVKKATAATTVLPKRTQVPGSPVTGNNLLNTIGGFAKSLVTAVALPPGFKMGSNGQSTTAQGTPIKTFDPNTGAYQEMDGTWYTQQGTALLYYNTANGVYQEEDGTYYTFDGTALVYYDPSTGNYVEESDPTDLYNKSGAIINSNYSVS